MKQIVIISGKGGTGKTVITSAFAALAKNAVVADCDVDVADLHLILHPTIKEQHLFKSGFTASIDPSLCMECRRCTVLCRFNAIRDDITVDPIACEGCGFCSVVCPARAITMMENESGEWFLSDTRFGPFVHAALGIGEENSGKLVALVRQKARELAEEKKADWVIIDGSPGIGCPVIASLSGIDGAVVVIEPTLSGQHDAERVIRVARHFTVPVFIVINKYDLNEACTASIESYAERESIAVLGKVKFDPVMVEAVVQGKSIIECDSGETGDMLKDIWHNLQEKI